MNLNADPEFIADLYHGEKQTLREIADDFGVSLWTVQEAMRKHGIPRRTAGRPKTPLPTLERIEALRASGMPWLEIAYQLGMSVSTLSKHRKMLEGGGNIASSDVTDQRKI